MDCRHCLEEISEYVDEELTPWAEKDIQSHLLSCPECNKYFRELKEMRLEIIDSINEVPVRSELGAMVLSAVKTDHTKKMQRLTWVTVAVLILLGSPLLFLFSRRILTLVRLIYSIGLTFLGLVQTALGYLSPITVFATVMALTVLMGLGLYVMRGLLREPDSREVFS